LKPAYLIRARVGKLFLAAFRSRDDLIDDLELEGNVQLHVLDIIRRDDR